MAVNCSCKQIKRLFTKYNLYRYNNKMKKKIIQDVLEKSNMLYAILLKLLFISRENKKAYNKK